MITPCITICQIDPIADVCVGCLRTIEEIEFWADMTEEEQLSVISELKTRKTTQ
jgi:predicted Fe-S protein YdhL (DUF1289 family)